MNFKFIDDFFSGPTKKQLRRIFNVSLGVILVYLVLSWMGCLGVDGYHVVSYFINPGELEKSPLTVGQWVFMLILTLLGFLLFSVLLSSIITAWITNLNDNITKGNRRYKLSGHVIVFGSGDQLNNILSALSGKQKDILVVSEKQPKVKQNNFIYYKGSRDDQAVIKASSPHRASEIYIIGEDNEVAHDSRSLRCLELLKAQTSSTSGNPIHCIITFDDEETTEVYQYLKGDAGMLSLRLYLVDAINEYEYRSEQFILNTDFMPVLRKESTKKANFILVGTGKVTQAMAYTICHACHYPKLNGKIRKTCISVIAPDAFTMRDQLILARPYLFEESVYESISCDGKIEVHTPERDILDIEWRFIEGSMSNQKVINIMNKWVTDEELDNRIIVCNMKSEDAIPAVLHLPRFVYGKVPIAVYLEDSSELIENANKSSMYSGGISIFGPASNILSDPLLKHRSECGQRVNFIYELKYPSQNVPVKTPMAAWYLRCEADKLSSIYCAIGLPLREKTFNFETEIEDVYEAEHRRWMMSEYLMGFRYGPEKNKTLFTHNDLVPFEDLPADEQKKDKILIDNRTYILTGDGEPVMK